MRRCLLKALRPCHVLSNYYWHNTWRKLQPGKTAVRTSQEVASKYRSGLQSWSATKAYGMSQKASSCRQSALEHRDRGKPLSSSMSGRRPVVSQGLGSSTPQSSCRPSSGFATVKSISTPATDHAGESAKASTARTGGAEGSARARSSSTCACRCCVRSVPPDRRGPQQRCHEARACRQAPPTAAACRIQQSPNSPSSSVQFEQSSKFCSK